MKKLSALIMFWLLLQCGAGVCGANEDARFASVQPVTTFSIVARDPETGDYGVAVQSRYFAVGAVVPHAAADTGAVATQASGNLLYGPQGLDLLGQARLEMQQALELHPEDDNGWWLLARIRLLEGEPEAATAAARRVLLENPAWRRLPAVIRASLGVTPELTSQLLAIESFRRVWESLALVAPAAP